MAVRVTRVSALVAGAVTSGNLRVTRVSALVAGAVTDADLRVTRSIAQVAGDTGATTTLRLSHLRLQVGTTSTVEPAGGVVVTAENTLTLTQIGTSVIGGEVRVTRVSALVAGKVANADIRVTRSIAQVAGDTGSTTTLKLSHLRLQVGTTSTLEPAGLVSTFASSALVLTQSATSNIFNLTATGALTLVQTNSVQHIASLTAQGVLTLVGLAESHLLTRDATNTLALTQQGEGIIPGDVFVTASSALTLSHTNNPALLTRSAGNTLTLQHSNGDFILGPNAIALTASDTLVLTHSGNRILILSTAIALTASNTLVLTQRSREPIELTASSPLLLTQSNSRAVGRSATHLLSLTQTVIGNSIRNLTASHTLNLGHSFIWTQFRNGLPLALDGDCGVAREYTPFSGGGSSLVRPIPPTLVKHSDVNFFFPANGDCAATASITLRTPNFGDRDRNQYNRVNRESRGGSLTIFRDPKWPDQRTLVMDFSVIKDSDVDILINFLESTLGQEVGFRDWHGRQWTGIIVSPDTPIVRQGVNRNDIALELEVTSQVLDYKACQPLTLTHSASAVVV